VKELLANQKTGVFPLNMETLLWMMLSKDRQEKDRQDTVPEIDPHRLILRGSRSLPREGRGSLNWQIQGVIAALTDWRGH
jgi:hypothetical protein